MNFYAIVYDSLLLWFVTSLGQDSLPNIVILRAQPDARHKVDFEKLCIKF